jgi:hypothetical protein
MEETMRRIIITATLLLGTLGAQAAPAPHHPAHRGTAGSACLARQRPIADGVAQLVGDRPAFASILNQLRTQCMPVHVCINCPPGY